MDDFVSYVTKNNNNKFLITGEPELIQEVNGEPKASTILDGQNVNFPYQLDVTGADGVTTGTIYLYEQVNGDYQQLGTYTVTFKEAN